MVLTTEGDVNMGHPETDFDADAIAAKVLEAANSRERQAKVCSAQRLIDKISNPELKEKILRLFANDTVSHRWLRQTLKSSGFPIASETISAHRQRQCQCFDYEGMNA